MLSLVKCETLNKVVKIENQSSTQLIRIELTQLFVVYTPISAE